MAEIKAAAEDKYEVNEAIETILDGIAFPIYIGKTALIPVTVLLIFLIVMAKFFVHYLILKILFVIVLYALGLPLVVLTTVLLLFHFIKQDMTKVFNITLNTVDKIYTESGAIKDGIKSGQKKESFTSVFSNVMHAAILPGLKHGIKYRVPFLGAVITGLISMGMDKVITQEHDFIDGVYEEDVVSPEKRVDKISKGTSKTVNMVFNGLSVPFVIAGLPITLVYGLIVYVFTLLM